MPIESKFAKLLTELGFKKVAPSEQQTAFILAKIRQLGKPIFMRMDTDRLVCTVATDETGATWQLKDKIVDLSPHGFVSLADLQPDIKEPGSPIN